MNDHQDIAAVIHATISLPLSILSLTFNSWWHHVTEQLPAIAALVLPMLGGVLLILQIVYYAKMIFKK